MLTINLREIYYWCKEDTFVDVTEEMFEAMKSADRQQAAYYRRACWHKAYYSLDCNDGIENLAINRMPSPETIFINKEATRELYANICKLPEIQQRRLNAYYFSDLNYRQIAENEGVSQSSVSCSVRSALKSLRNSITNNHSKKVKIKRDTPHTII
ncbi:MAG: sigma-70 family RNA polymerase sigma factor [Oscillospiraceae bacterium]|nr:sigma-70 family RNA polymerase sigma factor [Oscillospiraceae bacterium]